MQRGVHVVPPRDSKPGDVSVDEDRFDKRPRFAKLAKEHVLRLKRDASDRPFSDATGVL